MLLKEKFSMMGKKIEETVFQLVRAEKIASEVNHSRKLMKEIEPSMNKIKATLLYLKRRGQTNNGDYKSVLEDMDNELERIKEKVSEEIEIPNYPFNKYAHNK